MFGGPYSEGGQKTSPTRGRAMPALCPQNCGSAGGPQRAARGRMRALHGSTTNIRHHLKEKHGVLPPNVSIPDPAPKPNLISLWGRKGKISAQQLLENNLLRWVISSKQPFQDILLALKSGNTEEATPVCNSLDKGEHQSLEFQAIEPLAKLRVLALWIQRSPQRRQSWNDTCNRMNLSNKFIEYDVDTRWNSTFRMLGDALKARSFSKRQLETFIYYEASFLSFSSDEWIRLSHIHNVLSRFNEFTLEKTTDQSRLPIYYELHDLLHDVAERKEDFADLTEDIASAVGGSIKKYIKYYTFMDASDLYYTALVLDPRVKGALLNELGEENAGGGTFFKLSVMTFTANILGPLNHWKKQKVGSRMLQRLQPQDSPRFSDIDRYFDSARAEVSDMEDQNWLCDWWKVHKKEYPRMAAAARDYCQNTAWTMYQVHQSKHNQSPLPVHSDNYLAIPASEVSVESLFNTGRDVLGVRRLSMKGDTLRILMLLDDMYK
ncbi:hypothetical protein N7497_000972 [Penicillium chrysogenum]|nr:hypothetical protein N7497_000972 [Penicillium chrysogenum]